MIYGYARVSTTHQNLDRQIINLKNSHKEIAILEEQYTGTTTDRPVFNKLLKNVKTGDTIVFDSVSRMSRNATEGIEIYENLFNRGIELEFLKEPHINTSVYKNALNSRINPVGNEIADAYIETTNRVLMILAKKQIEIAFISSEKEVQEKRATIREGIAKRKADGKQVGLTKGTKLTTKKSIQAKEQILKYSKSFNGTLNDREVMQMTGLARNTFYKYKSELLNN